MVSHTSTSPSSSRTGRFGSPIIPPLPIKNEPLKSAPSASSKRIIRSLQCPMPLSWPDQRPGRILVKTHLAAQKEQKSTGENANVQALSHAKISNGERNQTHGNKAALAAVLSRPRKPGLRHRLLLRRDVLHHWRTVHLPLRITHLHRTTRHLRYASPMRWRRRLRLWRSHMWWWWLTVHRRWRLHTVLRGLRLIMHGEEVWVFGGVVTRG